MKKLLILLLPITMLAQSNNFKPYHAPIDSIKPDSLITQNINYSLILDPDSIKLDSINIYDDRAYLDSTRYIRFKDYFKKINDSIKLNPSIFSHKSELGLRRSRNVDTTFTYKPYSAHYKIVIFYQKCSSCKLEMTKGFKEVIYYSNGDELISILDIKKKKFKYKIYKYL